jgi:ATP-dependent Clp protease ATP-binding subunit ClpC
MTGESPLRAAGRRAPAPAASARCSCELLLSLCDGAEVQACLAGFAVGVADLRRGIAELHAETEAEPADWRVRIGQRSAARKGAGELELLLAIVRSADCHAYQLLERAGVRCGALRKRLIDQLREAENLAAHAVAPRAPHRGRQSQLANPRPPAAREARVLPIRGDARASEARASGDPGRRGAPGLEDSSSRHRPGSDDLPTRQPRDDSSSRHRPGSDDVPTRQHRAPDESSSRHRLLSDETPRRHRPGPEDSSARLGAPVLEDSRRERPPATRPRLLAQRPEIAEPERPHPRVLVYHDHDDCEPRRDDLEAPGAHARPEPAVDPGPRPELRPQPRLEPIDPRDLPPLHGREATLARLADAVLRRSPRPPLLVGPHGCGRTLVASHLARILGVPVFLLSAASHADEDTLRADLAVVARQRGVAILDDLDQVGSDAPPIFLPALVKIWSSGQPPILTIVSPEGRARLETWLPGLSSTFDVLELPVLEGDELRAAVAAAAPAVLAQHGLSLGTGSRLAELTRVADRFLGGLAMPGRALDLLDLACARTAREGRTQVQRDTWIDIVCERSGIPRERVEGLGNQEMLDLEGELARQVVGHEHAIKALAQLIRRNRAGFSSQRPVATVLLLGPSGVGKTEIAKALCGALFDRPDALVRLDMSEYAESHAVARVIGAPPGYVGHEQGGALTDPLLRHPHCVVLLDEIEKAHRDVHQLLLQVLDEGRLTDGRGRTVDFRHAVLIMTSNLGAGCLLAEDEPHADSDARALEAARAAFPVELWNRIEAPLVLHPLRNAELATICARLVRASSERLFRERGIRFKLSDRACRHVVGLCGRDAALGARPLRHVLTRVVEARIADAILRGQVRAGMQVEVDVDGEALVLATTRA